METNAEKIAILVDRTEKFQEIPQYEGVSLADRTTALAALYSADALESVADQSLRQADALERQAEALERQADALERLELIGERLAIAFEKFALCVNPIKGELVIERP